MERDFILPISSKWCCDWFYLPLFLDKGGGTLDTVLKAIGLGDQIRLWLGDRSINNISLAFTSVWRYTGFNFLVFLGAIQSINPEVYEAAEIDGANRWNQFRYIIIPSIRNIVFLNIILGVSGSLSVFDIPYIMTGGSNETSTFVIQTIDTAFKYNKVGLGYGNHSLVYRYCCFCDSKGCY